jgi:carbon-monoxide dehydrogenase large subunit
MSGRPLAPTPSILAEDVARLFASPEVRVEGRLKVTGQARYAADVHLPGMLYAKFLTSPRPHAQIVSINTAAARAIPGVHAVLTGADVAPARFGRQLQDWPVLAWDRVRFIGDRVAAVAAETREVAEAGVRALTVEYEDLPAVYDPLEALREGAPVLHPDASQYTFLAGARPPVPHPNVQGYHLVQKGNPDMAQAFARADRVFEHTFTTPRQHQGYIEPHATVVWIDANRVVNVVSTNKAPFSLRTQMAAATGLEAAQIVVDSGFIGGDFGGKGLSLDEFACYFLARATGRPVKAVMTYADELLATNPRHAAVLRLRSGVDRAGLIVAHEAEVVFNGGAYAAGKPVASLVMVEGHGTLSAYRVPNTRLEVKTVYTNTVPGGHMRSPGQVQACFAGESHVDMIAVALGMDPLEFRLRNALAPGDTGPANELMRQPRAREVLETLRAETRWGQQPLPPHRGRGISLFARHIGSGKTSVTLRLRADATIEVVTGLPDQGAGSHTLIRRVAAAVLSLAPERIIVTRGTTATAPYDAGAGASRVTHVVGQATQSGATALKEQLEELAAEVLGYPLGEVRLEQDHFVVGDGSGARHAFAEVAARLTSGEEVEASGRYDPGGHQSGARDFSFSALMVEVEVDPDTGEIRICDAVLAVDVGTILNPVAHQGQLEGGFVYGLGGALMEELPVEDGRVTALNLGEYKLPTSMDAPPLRTVHVPATTGPGPFGAKMAGEVSNIGVAPAVANAVAAAVGARVTDLPLTAERVLRARGG